MCKYLSSAQVRDKVRTTVETIVLLTAGNSSLAESVLLNSTVPTDFACLKLVVSAFSDQCFNLMKVGCFSALYCIHLLFQQRIYSAVVHTACRPCPQYDIQLYIVYETD